MKLFLYYAVVLNRVTILENGNVGIEEDVLSHIMWSPTQKLVEERLEVHVKTLYPQAKTVRQQVIEYSVWNLLKQLLHWYWLTPKVYLRKWLPTSLGKKLFPLSSELTQRDEELERRTASGVDAPSGEGHPRVSDPL